MKGVLVNTENILGAFRGIRKSAGVFQKFSLQISGVTRTHIADVRQEGRDSDESYGR